MKYTTQVASGTLEIEVDGIKSFIEQVGFFQSLPKSCPVCGADLVFTYKEPQGYTYYGMACQGPTRHETNLGQKKEGGTLYYKDEWTVYDAQRGEAVAVTPNRTVAAPPAPAQHEPPHYAAHRAPIDDLDDEAREANEAEQDAMQKAEALGVKKGMPTLSDEKVQGLMTKLSEFGITEHLTFASSVLGRKVESLSDLTAQEGVKVYEAAQPVWMKWKTDSDAQAYGSKSGVFAAGQRLMNAWEKLRDSEPDNLYAAWWEDIERRKAEGKEKAA